MAKKTVEINEAEVRFLREVLTATESGSFLYSNPVNHTALLEAKLIEVNMELKNEEECVATRATKKAVEYLVNVLIAALPPLPDEKPEVVETLPATALKPQYVLVSAVPVPEPKRGGAGRSSQWPFGKMEVGQSFFIADGIHNDEAFEAVKKYASTVSSATRRYSVPIEGQFRTKKNKDGSTEQVQKLQQTRSFIIRAAVGDPWGQPGVKGAGVWRTK